MGYACPCSLQKIGLRVVELWRVRPKDSMWKCLPSITACLKSDVWDTHYSFLCWSWEESGSNFKLGNPFAKDWYGFVLSKKQSLIVIPTKQHELHMIDGTPITNCPKLLTDFCAFFFRLQHHRHIYWDAHSDSPKLNATQEANSFDVERSN